MANLLAIKLPVGASFQLHPLFLDQNGRPLSPQPDKSSVSYSSDSAAASVDANGKVTAVSAGDANISASSGSLSSSRPISVYVPVASSIRV